MYLLPSELIIAWPVALKYVLFGPQLIQVHGHRSKENSQQPTNRNDPRPRCPKQIREGHATYKEPRL